MKMSKMENYLDRVFIFDLKLAVFAVMLIPGFTFEKNFACGNKFLWCNKNLFFRTRPDLGGRGGGKWKWKGPWNGITNVEGALGATSRRGGREAALRIITVSQKILSS